MSDTEELSVQVVETAPRRDETDLEIEYPTRDRFSDAKSNQQKDRER